MAATLSSFIPPLFRNSLQQPERFEGDFSYSYSDLPVFRSRDNDSKLEQDGGQNHRQKIGGNLVRKRSACDDAIFGGQNFCYEERKAVSLPYQNVDRCISLPRAKFDIQTACTNLPPKSSASVDKEKDVQTTTNQRGLKFRIIPDPPKSSGDNNIPNYNNIKCEEAKKRFEFQTTCTNLPPKNVDKENRVSYEGQISNALRFKLKNRCEEARRKFEFRTACENNFAKPLTEGLIRRESSCKNSPIKTFEFRTSQNNADKFDYHGNSRVSPSKAAHESATNIFKSGDSRNLPPKFDRNSDDRSKKPESSDFIDEIGAYLRKSDQNQSPPLTAAGNAVNSDDIFDFDVTDAPKDSQTVESSVRRLRNSIFSSLKLPRRFSDKSKMAGQQNLMMGSLGRDGSGPRNYALVTGSLTSSGNSKRKSAVEMLAESKAFYVKSETVLDRKQELPLRVNSALASTTGAHYATLSGRHRRGGGEALQSQLRRLLGSTSMQSPNDAIVTHESRNNPATYYEKRSSRECSEWEIPSHPSSATRSHYNSGTFSGNSSSGTSGSKGQVKSDPEHSRTSNSVPFPGTKGLNRPSSSGDNRIFFPDSFVVPKPSRSDPANVFSNSFSIGSPFSSPEKIDARQILSVVDAYEGSDYGILDPKSNYYDGDLVEDFSTISPPAEYAITERSNYRYVRSNSHSHTMKVVPDNSYAININSHKSLPDLHKQAEHYTEEERRLSGASGGPNYLGVVCDPSVPRLPQCETTMRSSEALSSYSKATSGRSNRSSVFSSKASDGHSRRSISCHNSDPSAQTLDDTYYYNRSGSSYARDSGGSSGHCSGGPPSLRVPPAQQQRRDSGSSTQHSRSHRYSSYYDGYELESSHLEYRVSAPPQFQDGATTPYQQGSLKSQYQGEPAVGQAVSPHQSQYQQVQGPPQYQGDHHQASQLNVNATVQICANFGGRGMQGATLTRVATGIEDGRSQTLVGIHFQASIPPVQFQDGQPQGYGSYGSEGFYGACGQRPFLSARAMTTTTNDFTQVKVLSHQLKDNLLLFNSRRESGARESRHMMPLRSSSAYNQAAPPRYSRPADEQAPVAPAGPGEDPTTSPPGLGNFRRQRCLRYKQRRPVLRSKSDISDRYYRGDGKTFPLMDKPSSNTPPSSTDNESPDRITRSQLDKFFDQFGLNDESYQTIILTTLKKPSRSKTKPKGGTTDQQNNVKKSSPNHTELAANVNANCGSPKVYVQEDENADSSDSLAFSEISIADSNLIANNGDYTVQGMGTKDPRLYRSCEPPSIVERNARIIKWLCNCRKLQAA